MTDEQKKEQEKIEKVKIIVEVEPDVKIGFTGIIQHIYEQTGNRPSQAELITKWIHREIDTINAERV